MKRKSKLKTAIIEEMERFCCEGYGYERTVWSLSYELKKHKQSVRRALASLLEDGVIERSYRLTNQGTIGVPPYWEYFYILPEKKHEHWRLHSTQKVHPLHVEEHQKSAVLTMAFGEAREEEPSLNLLETQS